MSIVKYRVRLLTIEDFERPFSICEFIKILKAWRNENVTAHECKICKESLTFLKSNNFQICCNKFYFLPTDEYLVKSVAVRTPRCHFLSPYLDSQLRKHRVEIRQDFVVLPDPIYWQTQSTLCFEMFFNFLSNKDQLKKFSATKLEKKKKAPNGCFHEVYPNANHRLQQFYKKIMTTPLYYGSLQCRTQGKQTPLRRYALAKRAEKTGRAMIVPAPYIKANEIVVCKTFAESLNVENQWCLISRFPTLSPDSFVAVKVIDVWDHECIGISPLILSALSADFDGDESNLFFVSSICSICECKDMLNSERNMWSFTQGIKLQPCTDMILAYYYYLKKTDLVSNLQTIYEIHGSKACFDSFHWWQAFYLDVTENVIPFCVCFQELENLQEIARGGGDYDTFLKNLDSVPHEIMTLELIVRSKSKGSFYHLYQLVGAVQSDIPFSFLQGIPAEYLVDYVIGAQESMVASVLEVWLPGYNYFKSSSNQQGIIVDYAGQVVDNEQVLCSNALDYSYYEDIMSKDTFQYVFEQLMVQGKQTVF